AKPEVARQALAAGANIINDITALADPAMARVIGEIRPGLVLMHMQGEPRTMQQNPNYENLIEEVNDFLAAAASRALAAGATAENIVIDPGIGFGKTWEHNLQLIRETKRFTELGYPVLIGPSRKRFIGELTGKDVDRRLYGSIGAVAAAVVLGARIVRVHDVAPMIDAVRVAEAIVGMDE
nr:dihydropteroate synthase [bacterium]